MPRNKPMPDVPSWSHFLTDDNGYPYSNLANALHALRTDPQLRGLLTYDEMMCIPVVNFPLPTISGKNDTGREDPRPIAPVDYTHLQEWIQHNGLPKLSSETSHQAVTAAAHERSFHPVKDYLNDLVWDASPRVDGWLATYLGAEASPYTAAIGRMFLAHLIRWAGSGLVASVA